MPPPHFSLSPAHVPTLYFMVNLWVQHCGPPWALHPLCHERGLVPGAWQGLSAGSRPQSAVAQGHLCWLPSPSARGGSIPLPGSASRGDRRAGSSTAPSLHPSIRPGGCRCIPERGRGWRGFLLGSAALGLVGTFLSLIPSLLPLGVPWCRDREVDPGWVFGVS